MKNKIMPLVATMMWKVDVFNIHILIGSKPIYHYPKRYLLLLSSFKILKAPLDL